MKNHFVTTLGFLIAPLVSALIIAGLAVGNLGYLGAIGLLPITYVFSLFATLLIGLPSYLILNRFDKVNWWSALLVGLFAGVAGSLFYRLPNELRIDDFLTMVPVGGLSALVFWLIWRQGNKLKAKSL